MDGLRGEHPALAVAAVTTDHVAIGRIHARQLAGLCPDGAQVLYVQGPVDTGAASQRLGGFEEATRGRSYELKVVNGEWTEASAEKAIAAIFGGFDIHTGKGFDRRQVFPKGQCNEWVT